MSYYTNADWIKEIVSLHPGHTANWYKRFTSSPCRNFWWYAAFERTARRGIIQAELVGYTTVYYPVKE